MRLKIVKSILWLFIGLGTVAGLARFIHGLGATTNLTDVTPWGLWIGFDVMGGVALAAGGFVIAAIVYIFRLEQYRPILRAAVLTAFLGYLAVAVGLLFDLGLPWNIWHMIIFWNPHSPLFEVGWCVMLYLGVLFLEFAPVWLEKTPFKNVYLFLKRITIPLVILGVMLSTLHQSSLGSLMLIIPFRVHALWYTPIVPILFFTSAICLGLMMVTLESIISTWLYNKEPETKLLAGLGKAAVYILSIYLFIKIGDLVYLGKIGLLFSGSWESILFLFELMITAIIPIIILSISTVRNSRGGQLICAIMVVFGFVLNRINISGIATVRATGTEYFPSLLEFFISMWVVSGAVLIFLFFVENFKVWESEAKSKTGSEIPPSFDSASTVWNSEILFNSIKRYSLMFVIGAVLAFFILPENAIMGASPEEALVEGARISDTFLIDGNRSDMAVVFDHDLHKEKNGDDNSCILCHHMNKPLSEYTSCAECHSDMFLPVSIFDHDLHRIKLGENDGCVKCHYDPDLPKTTENVTTCSECHDELRGKGSVITISAETVENVAPGYKDAMHGLCVNCHEKKAVELNRPGMQECAACHKDLPDKMIKAINKLYQKKTDN